MRSLEWSIRVRPLPPSHLIARGVPKIEARAEAGLSSSAKSIAGQRVATNRESAPCDFDGTRNAEVLRKRAASLPSGLAARERQVWCNRSHLRIQPSHFVDANASTLLASCAECVKLPIQACIRGISVIEARFIAVVGFHPFATVHASRQLSRRRALNTMPIALCEFFP